MSWKPCRGGRVLLDKNIEINHYSFFSFQESTNLKDKTKIAFKWLRAAQYLGDEKRVYSFIGTEFINKAKQSTETYKPFLKYINSIQNV